MKKFTFMLMAAFFAVAALASVPEKRGMQALNTNAVVTSSAKQITPKAKAVKVQAPVADKFQKMTQQAKANLRKAPKKMSPLDFLNIDWMLCSNYFEYDETAGGLVDGSPAAGGTPVSFKLSEDMQSISIEGFTSDATEAIQATFEIADEEMEAQGIFVVVTIPDGQTLLETDYGPIILKNVSAEEDGTPIKGYVSQEGTVIFDAVWADLIGGDGEYAGYQWSGYYYSSIALPVNGAMTWSKGDDDVQQAPVVIIQDPEEPKYVTVYNFSDEQTAIEVTMKDGNKFAIDSQLIFDAGSTYGQFYTYSTDGSSVSPIITGTGTENTLTFDGTWTLYAPTTGYWYGLLNPATITLAQGEFVYPVIEDVAAVPATPEPLSVGNYDASKGYGYFAFVIPTTDVDGNELKEENLFYQLYSDIAGDIQPITFTPDICERLTEDMTIIPYTFTDNWDFADNGTYKVIYLNYDFNSIYDHIGVKSIYTGGGETNESEIAWTEVEKPEPVDLGGTFNFNEMDVPVSSNTANDGDITEPIDLTEGGVTLTISPKEEGKTTENRFWGTTNGPQLRMYSGTMTFTVPEGNAITGISINYGKYNTGNTATPGTLTDYAENKVAVWTPAEGEEPTQTVVINIAGNTQINSIEVTVEGGSVIPVDDELIVLPEGVEPIEYTLSAAGYTSQSSIDIEETKYVAFNGTDVYLQGLAYYFPEAYVKGKLNSNGQIVVPSGQFVGEDEYGAEFIVALGVDEEDKFTDEANFVFDIDTETGVISLAEGIYYGESGTKDATGLWDYFETAVYTPGAYVEPDPVVAPENLETETYYLSCNTYSGKVRARELQLGLIQTAEGTDMYIQGLCEYLPEAWVKGTVDTENKTVTFASGQYYGTYEERYRLFFVGYDEETEDIADVVFSINDEEKTLTTDQWIVLSGKQNEISYYDYYTNVVISKDMPEIPEVVVAPEDLVTEAYAFKGFDTYYEEDTYSEVQVGFYGEDQVYIQGLSDYVPDAWVVGTIENGVVTIPETYMGIYEGLFGDSEVFFSGTTFVYDAEAGTFTSEDGYVTYETPDDEYMMDEFINVVLTKLYDVAATPADPEITEFQYLEEETKYPKVKFNIPTFDVNGTPIISGKLTYQLFIEKDGQTMPLVLSAELYEELDEDMSEIPYGFTEDWDIYTGTVYLNQGEEEIDTWTKIGIQSIYYGGGECNKSNIVWFNNDTANAINSVESSNKQDVIYNIAGQRVQKLQKGLFIVNGKKVAVK